MPDRPDLLDLTDRVLVASGRSQLHGTQHTGSGKGPRPRPVHDPEHLDERRAVMGLEPAAEYDERVRRTYAP